MGTRLKRGVVTLARHTIHELPHLLLGDIIDHGRERVGYVHLICYHIALAIHEFSDQFPLIARHLHADTDTDALGVFAGKHELKSEVFTTKVEVTLWTIKGEDYEFAVLLYVGQVEMRGGLGRGMDIRRLLSSSARLLIVACNDAEQYAE